MIDEIEDPAIYAWRRGVDYFSLTGARRISPDEFRARWHAEPGGEPRHSAYTLEDDPTWKDEGATSFRMAPSGDWTVGIELTSDRGRSVDWLLRLSVGTDVWNWTSIFALHLFSYARDGRLLVSFEPPTWPGCHVGGDEPHLLDEHLARFGLLWPGYDDARYDTLDKSLFALRMISAVWGVQLTKELVLDAELPAAFIARDLRP